MADITSIINNIKNQIAIYARRKGDINIAISPDDETIIRNILYKAVMDVLIDSGIYRIWGDEIPQIDASKHSISKIRANISQSSTTVNLPYNYDEDTIFIIPVHNTVDIIITEIGSNYFKAVAAENVEVDIIVGGIVKESQGSADNNLEELIEVIPTELIDCAENFVIYRWYVITGELQMAKSYYDEYDRMLKKRRLGRHTPTASRKYRMI